MASRDELLRRQRALADFGDFVLDHEDLDDILNEGCRLIARALDVDLAKVIQIERDRNMGFVRAGVGWKPGVVGHERISLSERSSEAFAIEKTEPVITNDIAHETRFCFPAFLRDHGVIALVNFPILLPGRRPWGVLQVDARRPRAFDRADIEFLKTYAMVVGPVIDRIRVADEREAARRTLSDREERLHGVLDGMGESFGLLAPDFTILEYNREALRLDGRARGEIVGRSYWEVFPGSEDSEVGQLLKTAMAGRTPASLEHFHAWQDGHARWLEMRAYPSADGALAIFWRDVTDRHEAEIRLRESEERFRQFASASEAGLWIRDAVTLAMEYVSPAIARIYGVASGALLGDVNGWAGLIVPEDRPAALEHIEAARQGRAVVHEFRIRRPDDGSFRWIRSTGFPLVNAEGQVQRIGGLAEDITEARLLTEHQGVLMGELQHRVRNIMAMIRSLANRTADGAADTNDYRALLEGRLRALARVQTLLTREDNTGGSLREIIESEVSAQGHEPGQVGLTGPDISLSPKAVEVLTLAFHELATNALKYGAFSAPQGRLSVSWAPFEKQGRPWLALDWTETGVPPPSPTGQRGFGSDLIEGRIPYELGGTGTVMIGPAGAHCRLEFPLRDGESILETDAPAATSVFGGVLDMADAPDLTGRSVLVVEDDYYLAADTASALRGAGAEILGPCPSEEAVLALLAREAPTHAVLDLNLGGGGPRFGIARLLKARGIPFVVMTGYDPQVIPAELEDVVRLQKPAPFRDIIQAVSRL